MQAVFILSIPIDIRRNVLFTSEYRVADGPDLRLGFNERNTPHLHGVPTVCGDLSAVNQQNAFNPVYRVVLSPLLPGQSPEGLLVENWSDSLLAPSSLLSHLRAVRFLLSFVVLLSASGLSAAVREHVILCGGPALRKWEDLRIEQEQHDRWWANFIRASTLRMAEIRLAHGKEAKLVWIVYRPGYITRARADEKPYPAWIQEQAEKRNCQLIWVNSGSEAISVINNRPRRAIFTFDFFGHSNRHCFMLDYGNEVMAISKAWIHERDLGKIRRSVFARGAVCQSYGCHTGESMSKVWRRKIGTSLIGAIGKTDYSMVGHGHLPTVSGSWTR